MAASIELDEQPGAETEQSKESPVVEDGEKRSAVGSNAVGRGTRDMLVDVNSESDFRCTDEEMYVTASSLKGDRWHRAL